MVKDRIGRAFQRLLGRFNHYARPGRRRVWWPLNGQEARQAAMTQIIEGCGIERIVETGTYRANSTVWFARFGIPTLTVEVNPRWAAAAKLRLRPYKHVTAYEGNSAEVLERIIGEGASFAAPTLFYLDAHWFEYLPLRAELELIVSRVPKAVIVIDDFEVPDDPGYGFDDYGEGKRLDLDYVMRCNLPPMAVFFPSAASGAETGYRRGSVVLAADAGLISILDGLSGLRRYFGRGAELPSRGLVHPGKAH